MEVLNLKMENAMAQDKIIQMKSIKKDSSKEFDVTQYIEEGIKPELRNLKLNSLKMNDYVETFKVSFEARNITGKLDQEDSTIKEAFHKEIVEPFIKKYVNFCKKI